MKLLACIALLLCAVNAADALRHITVGQRTKAAAASWTRPWFCGDLECPVFKNLTREEDYETREYSEGTDLAIDAHMAAAQGAKQLLLHAHTAAHTDAPLKDFKSKSLSGLGCL